MKNALARILLVACLAGTAAAAVPPVMMVQGVLTNGGGPITDTVGIGLKLFAAQQGGEALWSESYIAVEVTDGVFELPMGSQSPLTPLLFAESPELWLQIEVADAGPLPRTRLRSVAYSMFAAESAHAIAADVALVAGKVECDACITAKELGVDPGDKEAVEALESTVAAIQQAIDSLKGQAGALQAQAGALQAQAEVLGAALAAHKSGGDHDARYVNADGDAVTGNLAVSGLLRLGTGVCTAANEGAVRYSSELKTIEVCNGTDWLVVTAKKPFPLNGALFLHVENNADDALGNFELSTAPAAVFNGSAFSQGSYSIETHVYWNSPGDYSLITSEPAFQWTLHPDVGNFAFEWDYRHTSDTGYGAVLFSNTTAWVDTTSTYVGVSESGVKALPNGWMIAMYWAASRLYFNSSAGLVSWPYDGYHDSWKHLKLQRQGSMLELFVNGASKGTRAFPPITDTTPRKLIVCGSTNGGQSSYGASPPYSARYQMDEIQFKLVP